MPILYGKSGFSESYKRYLICKEFGWDYYTYERQPESFVNEILLIMNQESEAKKVQAKKVKRSMSKSARKSGVRK